MMKRRIFILALALMLVLSGCSSLTGGSKDDSGSEVSAQGNNLNKSITDEKLYSELDSLIGYPDKSSTSLPDRFTFIAMILGEPSTIEFDDGEEGLYCYACISRNDLDEYFLMEVSDIAETYEYGDIVKVDGEYIGSIYWVEDNDQVDVLEIKAHSMEAYTPEELETSTDWAYMTGGNKIEFVNAHYTEDTFGDVVVVYFEFTNNGSTDTAPSLGDFYIEYNGAEVSRTIFSLDEVYESALEYEGYGLTTDTYAGKTSLYYAAFSVDEKGEGEQGIYFDVYDDEFRLTHSVGLYVYENLEAMLAEPADETADGGETAAE